MKYDITHTNCLDLVAQLVGHCTSKSKVARLIPTVVGNSEQRNHILSEAVKLFKMNGVLAVASALFFCLKRVKKYLRNRMGQARMSSLCRISIHKNTVELLEDGNILHEQVIKKFVEKLGDFPFF